MQRSVTLQRAVQQRVAHNSLQVYRSSYTISAATNISTAIFRYWRRPVDPTNPTGTQEDVFSGVCTPEEMVALPLNNPRDGEDPWLRKANVDLLFTTQAIAEKADARLRGDIQDLLDALARTDQLAPAQSTTYTAGTP